MKYRCLVIDHDDTTVASTQQIHYPCFMEFLKIVRPGIFMTFEEYMKMNFHPGFLDFCTETLKFTEQEMNDEVKFWNNYVKTHVPKAFEGLREILKRYKKEGGIICVVSHSLGENILRDYMENDLPLPDEIYGWERPVEERKPSPIPLIQIMNKYGMNCKELLMLDDLKPGYEMAKKCNVDFAAATWAYNIPEIKEYMSQNSDYYLESVEELEKILFE